MGMPETKGVKEATKMKERLKAEEEAVANLKSAIKANRWVQQLLQQHAGRSCNV